VTVFRQLKKTYSFKSVKWKYPNKILRRRLARTELVTDVQKYFNTVEHYAWPNSPWYTGVGLHSNAHCLLQPLAKQLCGNHGNRVDYQDSLNYHRLLVQDLLPSFGSFTAVRSKIASFDAGSMVVNVNTWHKDETPFEVLRMVVPIVSEPAYLFQMDNQQPCWLEPGYVYAFDQSQYHRVLVQSPCRQPRLHLILSLVTWFTRSNDQWQPNEFCGKTHPLELFEAVEI